MIRSLCLFALLTVIAAPAGGADPAVFALRPAAPWSEVAIDDLHFIRATLRENHPGPVDEQNPWYRDWYEAGFDEAVGLAAQADSFAGYYFALRYYAAGFQDGHMGVHAEIGGLDPRLSYRWPGFAVRWDSGRYTVALSQDPRLATGDRLISCDGADAPGLAEARVAPFHLTWSIEASRTQTAPFLLIDEGNPFVGGPISTCTFADAGEFALSWRSIEVPALDRILDEVRRPPLPAFGLTQFAPGAFRLAIPSMDGGDVEIVAAIEALTAEVEAHLEALRSADLVVVDVRGNGGGSASLGLQPVFALWTTDYVLDRFPTAEGLSWRVSPGNIAFLEESSLPRLVRNFGAESEQVSEMEAQISAMRAAMMQGDRIWDAPRSDEVRGGGDSPVRGEVVLLTDGYCFSSCLTLADAVLALDNVTHAGARTRADAVYIDNRSETLPSGLGRLGFSMKVYRGRVRGHNEAYIPAHVFPGDLTDTAAVEAWLLALFTPSPRR